MKEKLLTTAETCEMLHVSRWTLKKWEDSEELIPIRTKGGHRRYKLSDVNRLIGTKVTSEDANPDIVAVYCRVSSHEQKTKGDLDRQKVRVLEHCLKKKYNVEHIFTEVGSGMNDNRSKLKRLFHLVRSHLINRVLIEHKDRLTRFNYSFLEAFFSSHGVVIECLENILPKSYEAELVEDIVSLMASMSAKIYGKRAECTAACDSPCDGGSFGGSACNRKKKAHLSVVNGDEQCN